MQILYHIHNHNHNRNNHNCTLTILPENPPPETMRYSVLSNNRGYQQLAASGPWKRAERGRTGHFGARGERSNMEQRHRPTKTPPAANEGQQSKQQGKTVKVYYLLYHRLSSLSLSLSFPLLLPSSSPPCCLWSPQSSIYHNCPPGLNHTDLSCSRDSAVLLHQRQTGEFFEL